MSCLLRPEPEDDQNFIWFTLIAFPDLDKMDSEKEEMNQADIAALHHFYSRHISDLPNEQALTELFAQVKNWITQLPKVSHDVPDFFLQYLYNHLLVCGFSGVENYTLPRPF